LKIRTGDSQISNDKGAGTVSPFSRQEWDNDKIICIYYNPPTRHVNEKVFADDRKGFFMSVLGAKTLGIGEDFLAEFRLESDTSTVAEIFPNGLEKELIALFAQAKGEFFENGVPTYFSSQLMKLVKQRGNEAVDILIDLIVAQEVNAEIASETLRWIGRMEDPITYSKRRLLLVSGLTSKSYLIRDGAILGLASMDDPWTMPYLERALEHEQIPELREDIEQVLEQLIETQQEYSAE
jgi:hypothetical protein